MEITIIFIAILILFILLAYAWAVLLVFLSAKISPFIFRKAGYKVWTPKSMTPSETTKYMLQAFLVVTVGLILAFFNKLPP